MIKFVVALTAALALPLPAATAAPLKPAANHDWVHDVVLTPDGGFRMGNPRARVTLVEYGSLACPHCRHFEETGYQPLLQKYVRSGEVSYEFRNFLLNGPDIAVSLLTRCAGARNFFPMAELVFERQPEWEEKFQRAVGALSDEQKAEIEKMPDQQRIKRFAELGGLKQLGSGFGVSLARADQCLSDAKALQRLLAMTQAASKAGVSHTPTFLINGKVTDAATWDQLEPLIRQAGARG